MFSDYRSKFVTAEEAAKAVQSGDWVDYGFGGGFPELMDKAIAARKGEVKDVSPREAAMRDALVDVMRGAGVEVVTDAEEAQRVLDEVNGEARMQAKKRALETVSVTSKRNINLPSFQVLTERRY